MSEKLYGGKCHICSHLEHSKRDHIEPMPWLPMNPLQCVGCSFCQADVVSTLLREAGTDVFDPGVRQAVDDLLMGRANPLVDQLRASLSETCEWRGQKWIVADMQRDESEHGAHWHLTLVPAVDNTAVSGERADQ
jgi:hypothetical protein